MKCLKIKRGSLGFRIESAFTLKDLNGLMEHPCEAKNLYQIPALAWRSTLCRLSLACWPTSSAGFDRPLPKNIKKAIFWWRTRSSLLRCGRTGEGRLRACWFLGSVCQPFFVLPPSIDSDFGRALLPKEYAMRLHQYHPLFFSFSVFVPMGH